MFIRQKVIYIYPVLIWLGLLFTSIAAGDDDLCEPFKHGKVSQSRLQSMLVEAQHGNLFRIQPESSKVGFCVNSDLKRVRAEFREVKGGLALWPRGRPINEQALVSIQVGSLTADDWIVEQLIKSEHFFSAEQYPEILFVSTAVHWFSETHAELRGELTMHGVTKPVSLEVSLTGIPDDQEQIEKILIKAGAKIRRSDFGMDALSSLIDDEVELCMMVEAVKHQS